MCYEVKLVFLMKFRKIELRIFLDVFAMKFQKMENIVKHVLSKKISTTHKITESPIEFLNLVKI